MTATEAGIINHFEREEDHKNCTFQLFFSMFGVRPLEPTSFVCKVVPVLRYVENN